MQRSSTDRRWSLACHTGRRSPVSTARCRQIAGDGLATNPSSRLPFLFRQARGYLPSSRTSPSSVAKKMSRLIMPRLSVRPSVCPTAQLPRLQARWLAACSTATARPSELCGLRTRPRTDVDPPRFLARTAIGGGISSRSPRGDILSHEPVGCKSSETCSDEN